MSGADPFGIALWDIKTVYPYCSHSKNMPRLEDYMDTGETPAVSVDNAPPEEPEPEEFQVQVTALSGGQPMVPISRKTPNPKCRLYWCLLEFIDWRHSQSCWYFRPLLWTSAPLTFSLVHLPPPPSPPFPVWISTGVCTVFIQCVTGEGVGEGIGASDRWREVPLLFNFFLKADI